MLLSFLYQVNLGFFCETWCWHHTLNFVNVYVSICVAFYHECLNVKRAESWL